MDDNYGSFIACFSLLFSNNSSVTDTEMLVIL